MPKRVFSDTMLTSPSLAEVSVGAEALFSRLILVADDFGCFDANPLVVAGRTWPLRREIGPDTIRGFLVELARAGMVRLWADNGRWFAFLTGWVGPNGQRPREEYSQTNQKGSKRHTPRPPDGQDPQHVEVFAFQENPSNSASRIFPPFPAPAVAVPDAVADAGTPIAPAASRPVPGEKPATKAAKKLADPRHAPVRQRLVDAFKAVRGTEYGFQGGKDARAVSDLLALSNDDVEIERRWKAALVAPRYAGGCSSIAELPGRWNSLAGNGPPATGRPPAIARMSTADEIEKGGRPF